MKSPIIIDRSIRLPAEQSTIKRCSCYDEGCDKIEDKTRCFIGINKSGDINIGIADGYCPFIHKSN